MTTLSTLLGERLSPLAQETNLEKGEISVFHPGTELGTFRCNFCWTAPGNGIAVVEIWGASGSGGKMCCCGIGVPGNPGGYSKRTVNVCSGSHVCGIVGLSCGNADQLCWRGCSQSTCITICGQGTCNCLCAEGGTGGISHCQTGTSMSCCLMANYSLCSTQLDNAGCHIVCNRIQLGRAFGGDINRCGGWSCTSFYHCNPECHCSMQDHVAVAPGIFATNGAVLTINREVSTGSAPNNGDGLYQLLGALNNAGRSPVIGGHQAACWAGSVGCGCYETWGCVPMLPYGVPGTSGYACSSVRDHGYRGGHGAVRIKFIGS
jgi:hypothetical protein